MKKAPGFGAFFISYIIVVVLFWQYVTPFGVIQMSPFQGFCVRCLFLLEYCHPFGVLFDSDFKNR